MSSGVRPHVDTRRFRRRSTPYGPAQLHPERDCTRPPALQVLFQNARWWMLAARHERSTNRRRVAGGARLDAVDVVEDRRHKVRVQHEPPLATGPPHGHGEAHDGEAAAVGVRSARRAVQPQRGAQAQHADRAQRVRRRDAVHAPHAEVRLNLKGERGAHRPDDVGRSTLLARLQVRVELVAVLCHPRHRAAACTRCAGLCRVLMHYARGGGNEETPSRYGHPPETSGAD